MATQIPASGSHSLEIRSGDRFEFGANWAKFLAALDDERISKAEEAIKSMLGVDDLTGKTFLDIGSGSGLSSLAARRIGAQVTSFDYDPKSVACTAELKRRYFPNDPDWKIEEGSVLNLEYLSSLGKFDVVYSWGVLHHTGEMWAALSNIIPNVDGSGKLFIALYNDQGRASKAWWLVKRTYVSLPKWLRFLVVGPCMLQLWGPASVRDLVMFRPLLHGVVTRQLVGCLLIVMSLIGSAVFHLKLVSRRRSLIFIAPRALPLLD